MEIQHFTDYIDAPYKMQEEDFEKIGDLLEKYPFFHTANMLYVKAAHNINYENYTKLISKISSSIPNREILHSLINLTEEKLSVETSEKVIKEEESDTRKEIRDRIQKRRKLRKFEKGEILNDHGRVWHETILSDFFKPQIDEIIKFLNNPDNADYYKAVGKVDSEKSFDQKADSVELSPQEEVEKRKADREKRRAERIKRTEDAQARKDEKSESISKDPYTKVIEIPKDSIEETVENSKVINTDKSSKVEDEVVEIFDDIDESTKPTETSEVVEEKDVHVVKSNEEEKFEEKKSPVENSKNVIIEDITVDETHDGKDESEVLENIYDKIITSKKPKEDIKEKHAFIEIQEDITGLVEDKKSSKKETIEEKEISDDIIISEDSNQKEIITEDKTLTKVDTDDEIEFIIEDDISDNESQITVETKVDLGVTISEDAEQEFELIDKKDEEQDQPKEIIKEQEEIKIESKVEDSKSEKEIEKADKEESENSKEAKDKEEMEIKAKAADDVLARIAAFKKKLQQDKEPEKETQKESEKETEKEPKDKLINKFVNEPSSIKRPVIDEGENIDISEESTIEKKPVITELMASIFVNQGKYDQAIEIYEKLILKNPEKKDYFAAKIEETQKLK